MTDQIHDTYNIDELISTGDASKIVGVQSQTVSRYCKKNIDSQPDNIQIKKNKLGRDVYFIRRSYLETVWDIKESIEEEHFKTDTTTYGGEENINKQGRGDNNNYPVKSQADMFSYFNTLPQKRFYYKSQFWISIFFIIVIAGILVFAFLYRNEKKIEYTNNITELKNEIENIKKENNSDIETLNSRNDERIKLVNENKAELVEMYKEQLKMLEDKLSDKSTIIDQSIKETEEFKKKFTDTEKELNILKAKILEENK
jgi:hypothetical protein